METSVMSRDLVKVWTIFPRDTTEGLRAPGDEYARSRTNADQLAHCRSEKVTRLTLVNQVPEE
jgi:hypothetical protein